MAESLSQKILVVDDNSRVLKLLELRLTQLGYQVFTAERVKDAVVTGIIVKPDLVVSEFTLPDLNGIEFKRILGSIPYMADIPLIFITSEEDLPVDFHAEPAALIDHLQKPYAFDELLGKIKASLRKASLGKSALNQSDQQTSVLQEMSLTDILQVLSMNKRSCTITLKQGEKTGRIYFETGRIVDAKAPGLRAEEALYHLITWREANFTIGDDPHDSMEETIVQDTHHLITEGLRRLEGLEEKARQMAGKSDGDDLEMTVAPDMVQAFSPEGSVGGSRGGQAHPDPFKEERAFLRSLVARGILKDKGG